MEIERNLKSKICCVREKYQEEDILSIFLQKKKNMVKENEIEK